MKKIAILFIVGILVGSTLGVAGIQTNQQAAKSLSQHLSTPQMQIQSTSNEYIMLELEGSSTYLSTAGHPRLPEIIQVVELPFGSTDISVLLTPQDITTQQIDTTNQTSSCTSSPHPRISKYRHQCHDEG